MAKVFTVPKSRKSHQTRPELYRVLYGDSIPELVAGWRCRGAACRAERHP